MINDCLLGKIIKIIQARPRLAEAMQGWLRGGSRLWWYLGSLLPAVNIFNGFAAVMFSEAGMGQGGVHRIGFWG